MRRIRTINLTSVIIILIGIPFIFQYWQLNILLMSFTLLGSVFLGIGNIFLLRRTLNPQLSAYIGVSILFAQLLLSNSVSGGFYDPNFSWLYLIPLLAGLLIDLRALWLFTCLVLFSNFAFFVLPQLGFTIPDLIPAERHATQSLANRVSAILALSTMVFGFLYERDRTEKALGRAKAKAEEMSRTKSDFLARVSHEIRTPMNAVIVMSGLMRETRLDLEQSDFAQTIEQSARHLLGLIDDILDFSKIEKGKLRLEFARFDPREVFEEVTEGAAERAHRKGLHINWTRSGNLPQTVIGDRTHLQKILFTLANNAVKFTDKGDVLLTAELRESDTGSWLLCRVQDSGIGIEASKMEHIFQPFAQGEESHSRRFGGTGLGLAICRELVHLLGGDLWVKSRRGGGTTFSFVVPVQPMVGEAKASERPCFPGLRVLVMDANPNARQNLTDQLASYQIEVETALDQNTARTLLERERREGRIFDLALLDRDFDIKTGPDFIKTLRREFGQGIARFGLLYPLGSRCEQKRARMDGFAFVLAKPVRASRLVAFLGDSEGKETAGHSSSGEAENPAERIPLKTAKILVAEDNKINQKVILTLLRRLGYDADLAIDGRGAIEAVSARSYDLVLMDCQMPEVDGYQASKAIRRQNPDLPIIAVTAHAISGEREHCLAMGMNDLLAKPIKIEALREILLKWLPPE